MQLLKRMPFVADGTAPAGKPTHTHFNFPRYNIPGVPSGKIISGKITEFDGKFEWKGSITIQTKYKSSESAENYSCYG